MFTKETQELAKPCYEAIKKIAKRQEKECPECGGCGVNLTDEKTLRKPCPVCNGKGKIKGKWEWEPEQGEWCMRKIGRQTYLYLIRVVSGKKLIVEPPTLHMLNWTDVTPLLYWERIEEILEGMEYYLSVHRHVGLVKEGAEAEWKAGDYEAYILRKDEMNKEWYAHSKSRQEAVQKAVIELGKEV